MDTMHVYSSKPSLSIITANHPLILSVQVMIIRTPHHYFRQIQTLSSSPSRVDGNKKLFSPLQK